MDHVLKCMLVHLSYESECVCVCNMLTTSMSPDLDDCKVSLNWRGRMVAALVSRNLSSCISQVLQLQSWSMRGCVGTIRCRQDKKSVFSQKKWDSTCVCIFVLVPSCLCLGSVVMREEPEHKELGTTSFRRLKDVLLF